MEKVDLKELELNINKLLRKQLVSGKILLDKLSFIDENSRKTAAYVDPNYTPFYYHLGKFIKPKSFLSFNFNLGLLESCFLKSCQTVDYFYGFHQETKDYYSKRMGIYNLKFKKDKKVYIGDFRDNNFCSSVETSWDFILINDEKSYDRCLEYLEFVWPYLNENGVITVENTYKTDSFKNFSESVNRESLIFNTRYGTGIIQK